MKAPHQRPPGQPRETDTLTRVRRAVNDSESIPKRPARFDTALETAIPFRFDPGRDPAFMHLAPIDLAILMAYILFVLGIGYWLKDRMATSEDYLLAGRSLPSWITGLSFMAANLGSLEIVGMIAMGAKYGMMTNHW